MVFVYLVHVTHVLRGSQSSKFMIMFYHAREADTESKYSRNPAARAKKSPENAVSAFRHESVHRVIYINFFNQIRIRITEDMQSADLVVFALNVLYLYGNLTISL